MLNVLFTAVLITFISITIKSQCNIKLFIDEELNKPSNNKKHYRK